jgi:hypothetical protein
MHSRDAKDGAISGSAAIASWVVGCRLLDR